MRQISKLLVFLLFLVQVCAAAPPPQYIPQDAELLDHSSIDPGYTAVLFRKRGAYYVDVYNDGSRKRLGRFTVGKMIRGSIHTQLEGKTLVVRAYDLNRTGGPSYHFEAKYDLTAKTWSTSESKGGPPLPVRSLERTSR